MIRISTRSASAVVCAAAVAVTAAAWADNGTVDDSPKTAVELKDTGKKQPAEKKPIKQPRDGIELRPVERPGKRPGDGDGALTRPRKTASADDGTASIVFLYYGDSKYETIGQETMKLKLAMQGYDKVVLLKHEEVAPIWDLSEADERLADVKDVPTNAKLAEQIESLADDGYIIDLWIFSHGWSQGFRTSDGDTENEDDDVWRDSDILDLVKPNSDYDTGYDELPLRMVWQVNCYGNFLSGEWRQIGAKVVVGPRYVNFFPNQFAKFAKEWNKGEKVKDCRDAADTAATRTIVHTYILADALTKRENGHWDGCPVPKTVLGSNHCAEDYFNTFWSADQWWQDGENGKQNMIYSSHRVINGNGNITKNSTPNW